MHTSCYHVWLTPWYKFKTRSKYLPMLQSDSLKLFDCKGFIKDKAWHLWKRNSWNQWETILALDGVDSRANNSKKKVLLNVCKGKVACSNTNNLIGGQNLRMKIMYCKAKQNCNREMVSKWLICLVKGTNSVLHCKVE